VEKKRADKGKCGELGKGGKKRKKNTKGTWSIDCKERKEVGRVEVSQSVFRNAREEKKTQRGRGRIEKRREAQVGRYARIGEFGKISPSWKKFGKEKKRAMHSKGLFAETRSKRG